jgi:hypothetical protein
VGRYPDASATLPDPDPARHDDCATASHAGIGGARSKIGNTAYGQEARLPTLRRASHFGMAQGLFTPDDAQLA